MSRSKDSRYHHGDLKRACIDAAMEVVEAKGPEALSFRKLAEMLEVSHAAPLAHFPDRAALDAALATRGFQKLERQLSEAGRPPYSAPPAPVARPPAASLPPPSGAVFRAASLEQSRSSYPAPAPSPIAYERLAPVQPERWLIARRLVALSVAWVRFAIEHPGLFRAMRVPGPSESEAGRSELAGQKAKVAQLFLDLVVLGQRAGEFRRGIPPERIVRLLTATTEGLAYQLLDGYDGGKGDRLKEAEQVLDLLLRGIAGG